MLYRRSTKARVGRSSASSFYHCLPDVPLHKDPDCGRLLGSSLDLGSNWPGPMASITWEFQPGPSCHSTFLGHQTSTHGPRLRHDEGFGCDPQSRRHHRSPDEEQARTHHSTQTERVWWPKVATSDSAGVHLKGVRSKKRQSRSRSKHSAVAIVAAKRQSACSPKYK